MEGRGSPLAKLEGHAEHVHALVRGSAGVFDGFGRLHPILYHVAGQRSPSFIRTRSDYQQGEPEQMLKKGNTVFLLEVLLQRYVYGRPLELKRQSDLRDAILMLLDMLVEQGSSAAFRMRDDFVTPRSPQLSICQ